MFFESFDPSGFVQQRRRWDFGDILKWPPDPKRVQPKFFHRRGGWDGGFVLVLACCVPVIEFKSSTNIYIIYMQYKPICTSDAQSSCSSSAGTPHRAVRDPIPPCQCFLLFSFSRRAFWQIVKTCMHAKAAEVKGPTTRSP